MTKIQLNVRRGAVEVHFPKNTMLRENTHVRSKPLSVASMLGIVVMSQNKQYLCTLGNVYLVEGKAVPLQAWTGPEGSRRVRLPDFKTIGT